METPFFSFVEYEAMETLFVFLIPANVHTFREQPFVGGGRSK